MTKYINNFVDSDPIEIHFGHSQPYGELISLSQRVGSCHFHHAMRPEQAREMAFALLEAATSLEIKEAA